jgi:hypothetical protein
MLFIGFARHISIALVPVIEMKKSGRRVIKTPNREDD